VLRCSAFGALVFLAETFGLLPFVGFRVVAANIPVIKCREELGPGKTRAGFRLAAPGEVYDGEGCRAMVAGQLEQEIVAILPPRDWIDAYSVEEVIGGNFAVKFLACRRIGVGEPRSSIDEMRGRGLLVVWIHDLR